MKSLVCSPASLFAEREVQSRGRLDCLQIMGSMTKIVTLIVLLCAVATAQAGPPLVAGTSSRVVTLQSVATAQPLAELSNRIAGMAMVTLPPEDKPKTHWPWWLRILAVIGVLVFIRLVAGSVRNKPTGPPPV